MRWLVTGASGFIGWHLVDRLTRDGHEVVAWGRGANDPWPDRDIAKLPVDITDARAVGDALAAARPDMVVHLAAQSQPTRSWSAPAMTMRINVEGTVNVLEAVRSLENKCRVIFAGSSAQYSPGLGPAPVTEAAPCIPDTPYGITKVAGDSLCQVYGRLHKLDIVRVRPFAWIGTHKEGDVASDIAQRVVAIERGATPMLAVGRTDVVRDIIDVRDGVSALLLLAQKASPGDVFNICRGQGTSIGELVAAYAAQAKTSFSLESDPRFMRPVDEMVRIGSADKIAELGWRAQLSLQQSVAYILDYWRGKPEL
jgi:GDP-4-dehydro-6-deoxy-D-mannose reductase